MTIFSQEKPSGPLLHLNTKGKYILTKERGMYSMDKGAANPEIKEKVVAYLHTVQKAKSKDIATAIGEKKSAVDLAVKELTAEDICEYLYITTTYIAIKGKVGAPE